MARAIRRNSNGKKVAYFFLGMLVSFLLLIGAVAGAGVWCWYSLTINKLEDFGGFEIPYIKDDDDPDSLKNLPVSDLVSLVGDLSRNIRTMSAQDLFDRLDLELPVYDLNGVDATGLWENLMIADLLDIGTDFSSAMNRQELDELIQAILDVPALQTVLDFFTLADLETMMGSELPELGLLQGVADLDQRGEIQLDHEGKVLRKSKEESTLYEVLSAVIKLTDMDTLSIGYIKDYIFVGQLEEIEVASEIINMLEGIWDVSFQQMLDDPHANIFSLIKLGDILDSPLLSFIPGTPEEDNANPNTIRGYYHDISLQDIFDDWRVLIRIPVGVILSDVNRIEGVEDAIPQTLVDAWLDNGVTLDDLIFNIEETLDRIEINDVISVVEIFLPESTDDILAVFDGVTVGGIIDNAAEELKKVDLGDLLTAVNAVLAELDAGENVIPQAAIDVVSGVTVGGLIEDPAGELDHIYVADLFQLINELIDSPLNGEGFDTMFTDSQGNPLSLGALIEDPVAAVGGIYVADIFRGVDQLLEGRTGEPIFTQEVLELFGQDTLGDIIGDPVQYLKDLGVWDLVRVARSYLEEALPADLVETLTSEEFKKELRDIVGEKTVGELIDAWGEIRVADLLDLVDFFVELPNSVFLAAGDIVLDDFTHPEKLLRALKLANLTMAVNDLLGAPLDDNGLQQLFQEISLGGLIYSAEEELDKWDVGGILQGIDTILAPFVGEYYVFTPDVIAQFTGISVWALIQDPSGELLEITVAEVFTMLNSYFDEDLISVDYLPQTLAPKTLNQMLEAPLGFAAVALTAGTWLWLGEQAPASLPALLDDIDYALLAEDPAAALTDIRVSSVLMVVDDILTAAADLGDVLTDELISVFDFSLADAADPDTYLDLKLTALADAVMSYINGVELKDNTRALLGDAAVRDLWNVDFYLDINIHNLIDSVNEYADGIVKDSVKSLFAADDRIRDFIDEEEWRNMKVSEVIEVVNSYCESAIIDTEKLPQLLNDLTVGEILDQPVWLAWVAGGVGLYLAFDEVPAAYTNIGEAFMDGLEQADAVEGLLNIRVNDLLSLVDFLTDRLLDQVFCEGLYGLFEVNGEAITVRTLLEGEISVLGVVKAADYYTTQYAGFSIYKQQLDAVLGGLTFANLTTEWENIRLGDIVLAVRAYLTDYIDESLVPEAWGGLFGETTLGTLGEILDQITFNAVLDVVFGYLPDSDNRALLDADALAFLNRLTVQDVIDLPERAILAVLAAEAAMTPAEVIEVVNKLFAEVDFELYYDDPSAAVRGLRLASYFEVLGELLSLIIDKNFGPGLAVMAGDLTFADLEEPEYLPDLLYLSNILKGADLIAGEFTEYIIFTDELCGLFEGYTLYDAIFETEAMLRSIYVADVIPVINSYFDKPMLALTDLPEDMRDLSVWEIVTSPMYMGIIAAGVALIVVFGEIPAPIMEIAYTVTSQADLLDGVLSVELTDIVALADYMTNHFLKETYSTPELYEAVEGKVINSLITGDMVIAAVLKAIDSYTYKYLDFAFYSNEIDNLFGESTFATVLDDLADYRLADVVTLIQLYVNNYFGEGTLVDEVAALFGGTTFGTLNTFFDEASIGDMLDIYYAYLPGWDNRAQVPAAAMAYTESVTIYDILEDPARLLVLPLTIIGAFTVEDYQPRQLPADIVEFLEGIDYRAYHEDPVGQLKGTRLSVLTGFTADLIEGLTGYAFHDAFAMMVGDVLVDIIDTPDLIADSFYISKVLKGIDMIGAELGLGFYLVTDEVCALFEGKTFYDLVVWPDVVLSAITISEIVDAVNSYFDEPVMSVSDLPEALQDCTAWDLVNEPVYLALTGGVVVMLVLFDQVPAPAKNIIDTVMAAADPTDGLLDIAMADVLDLFDFVINYYLADKFTTPALENMLDGLTVYDVIHLDLRITDILKTVDSYLDMFLALSLYKTELEGIFGDSTLATIAHDYPDITVGSIIAAAEAYLKDYVDPEIDLAPVADLFGHAAIWSFVDDCYDLEIKQILETVKHYVDKYAGPEYLPQELCDVFAGLTVGNIADFYGDITVGSIIAAAEAYLQAFVDPEIDLTPLADLFGDATIGSFVDDCYDLEIKKILETVKTYVDDYAGTGYIQQALCDVFGTLTVGTIAEDYGTIRIRDLAKTVRAYVNWITEEDTIIAEIPQLFGEATIGNPEAALDAIYLNAVLDIVFAYLPDYDNRANLPAATLAYISSTLSVQSIIDDPLRALILPVVAAGALNVDLWLKDSINSILSPIDYAAYHADPVSQLIGLPLSTVTDLLGEVIYNLTDSQYDLRPGLATMVGDVTIEEATELEYLLDSFYIGNLLAGADQIAGEFTEYIIFSEELSDLLKPYTLYDAIYETETMLSGICVADVIPVINSYFDKPMLALSDLPEDMRDLSVWEIVTSPMYLGMIAAGVVMIVVFEEIPAPVMAIAETVSGEAEITDGLLAIDLGDVLDLVDYMTRFFLEDAVYTTAELHTALDGKTVRQLTEGDLVIADVLKAVDSYTDEYAGFTFYLDELDEVLGTMTFASLAEDILNITVASVLNAAGAYLEEYAGENYVLASLPALFGDMTLGQISDEEEGIASLSVNGTIGVVKEYVDTYVGTGYLVDSLAELFPASATLSTAADELINIGIPNILAVVKEYADMADVRIVQQSLVDLFRDAQGTAMTVGNIADEALNITVPAVLHVVSDYTKAFAEEDYVKSELADVFVDSDGNPMTLGEIGERYGDITVRNILRAVAAYVNAYIQADLIRDPVCTLFGDTTLATLDQVLSHITVYGVLAVAYAYLPEYDSMDLVDAGTMDYIRQLSVQDLIDDPLRAVILPLVVLLATDTGLELDDSLEAMLSQVDYEAYHDDPLAEMMRFRVSAVTDIASDIVDGLTGIDLKDGLRTLLGSNETDPSAVVDPLLLEDLTAPEYLLDHFYLSNLLLGSQLIVDQFADFTVFTDEACALFHTEEDGYTLYDLIFETQAMLDGIYLRELVPVINSYFEEEMITVEALGDLADESVWSFITNPYYMTLVGVAAVGALAVWIIFGEFPQPLLDIIDQVSTDGPLGIQIKSPLEFINAFCERFGAEDLIKPEVFTFVGEITLGESYQEKGLSHFTVGAFYDAVLAYLPEEYADNYAALLTEADSYLDALSFYAVAGDPWEALLILPSLGAIFGQELTDEINGLYASADLVTADLTALDRINSVGLAAAANLLTGTVEIILDSELSEYKYAFTLIFNTMDVEELRDPAVWGDCFYPSDIFEAVNTVLSRYGIGEVFTPEVGALFAGETFYTMTYEWETWLDSVTVRKVLEAVNSYFAADARPIDLTQLPDSVLDYTVYGFVEEPFMLVFAGAGVTMYLVYGEIPEALNNMADTFVQGHDFVDGLLLINVTDVLDLISFFLDAYDFYMLPDSLSEAVTVNGRSLVIADLLSLDMLRMLEVGKLLVAVQDVLSVLFEITLQLPANLTAGTMTVGELIDTPVLAVSVLGTAVLGLYYRDAMPKTVSNLLNKINYVDIIDAVDLLRGVTVNDLTEALLEIAQTENPVPESIYKQISGLDMYDLLVYPTDLLDVVTVGALIEALDNANVIPEGLLPADVRAVIGDLSLYRLVTDPVDALADLSLGALSQIEQLPELLRVVFEKEALRDITLYDILNDASLAFANVTFRDILEDIAQMPAAVINFIGDLSVGSALSEDNSLFIEQVKDLPIAPLLQNVSMSENLKADLGVITLAELQNDPIAALGHIKLGTLLDVFETDGTTVKDGTQGFLKAIANITISDLTGSDDILSKIDGTIGDLLGITENDSAMLQAIGELQISTVKDEFPKMLVGDILGVIESKTDADGDGVYEDIVYTEGTSAIVKAVAHLQIGNLESELPSLTVGEVLGAYDDEGNLIDGTANIVKAMAHIQLGDLSDELPNLLIGDIIGIIESKVDLDGDGFYHSAGEITFGPDASGEEPHAILKAIADLTIRELENSALLLDRINTLQLSDVITIDENSPLILRSLASVALEDLGTTINTLTLGQMVEIDDVTSPKILVALKNSTLSTLGDDINNLTIDQVLDLSTATGILSVIDGSRKITELDDAIHDALSSPDMTINVLLETMDRPPMTGEVGNQTVSSVMDRLTGTLILERGEETQAITYLEYVLNMETYIAEGWIPQVSNP